MVNIDAKYEVWKNKLLDLGKRNRLLNYKDTQRSNVKIDYPDCTTLWNMFVKDEKPIVFPYETEEDGEVKIESFSNVTTNKNSVDLIKALRNLRSKAKTAIEEQGVNVLYLSYGFLNWTEPDNDEQIFSSPLILVPASLTIESIKSPYVLSLHEDEIILNPTLVYKLENDFGITLPTFDDNEDIDDFLNRVKESTTIKNWSVSKDVSLGLLSFLKINMYTDLKVHKDTILDNPIVKVISGDKSKIDTIPSDIVNYDFDKNEKPIDVFQVVDADSSQQDAILMAKRGISFVLQGPPGTGKSQTVTNIIAECLADGKKVLFVSEKMAALDVVHNRLAGVGLDDFCLVLHSHKANKKNVLEQLNKVLEYSQKKVTLSDEAYYKLDALQEDKDKLNEYAKQVYSIVKPLGKSIYEVNGIIANLNDYEDCIFPIDNVRKTTKEQYNNYIYLISSYATTVRKMTNDYKENPWRDSTLKSVSNEFRQDTSAKLGALLPKLTNLQEEFNKVLQELSLDVPNTLNGVNSLIETLNSLNGAYHVPSKWILTESLKPLCKEADACLELKNNLISLTGELEKEYKFIGDKEESISLSIANNLDSLYLLKEERNNLVSFIKNNAPYSYWVDRNFNEVVELLTTAKNTADCIKFVKGELLKVYEPSVFEFDYRSMLARIKTEYSSFTKYFKKAYWQDKKTIKLHHKEVVKKVSDEEMLYLVEKLRNVDETKDWYLKNEYKLNKLFGEGVICEDLDYSILEKQINVYKSVNNAIKLIDKMIEIHNKVNGLDGTLKEHYEFLYSGIWSNWELICNSLTWAKAFKYEASKINASEEFIKKVCEGEDFVNYAISARENLLSLINGITADYNWFISNFNNAELFSEMPINLLYNRFNGCANGLSLLEEWIDYRLAKEKCANGGLGEFISSVEERNIPIQNVHNIFKKRFFRLWLDSVLGEYPAVMNFRRKAQESTIDEFASLDKVQFDIAKARIKSKLINALPSLEHFTSGVDEISILKRELNKQRRIMPIRRLFKAIPNLLLTLKPCLMMSPLSVSLFLEAETYKFDVVIFDEASQVCTENAIGAISRSKQVIIAGDSKQLPPTNFFQATVSDGDYDNVVDEDDEFEDVDAYESILDEANMLPERTLRWHYRSRHESLIAFSNAHIYKNKLITFPSNIEKANNAGVEYVYVPNGFYDRGGKKGNVIEANKVADLVFKHFKEQPHRSLGVIAFGEVQQQAIESVIRERRLKNQEFESFFSEDNEEAFFVKNLENVQGDERDTIIFSIGYAKDSEGVFRMNFGPLSKSGGERRLNVAVTRAKYNVKLVGSILPTDINESKITTEGPKLLKAYIDFAINGPSVLASETVKSENADTELAFEDSVANFLTKKGYSVETHVGCSDYKIDVAVKHPTIDGVFVLGIECDGDAYHSARTARERDRLRQTVLENIGWKIYRVWSTDWVKDPITEGDKLITALENAIQNYTEEESSLTDYNESEEESSFVNVEDKMAVQFLDNPYGFEEVERADFTNLPRNANGYLELTDCILEIVSKEYPVHYDIVCQRIAPLFGNEKATVKIRREVDFALNKLSDRVVKKGDFLYPTSYKKIPVRIPNDRKIQHISTDELVEAMYRILKTCVGTTIEGLSSETARVYGFKKAGQNITLAMLESVDKLLDSGKAEEIEGKLRIKKK